jgi:multidrug efflux pump subunit AcrB
MLHISTVLVSKPEHISYAEAPKQGRATGRAAELAITGAITAAPGTRSVQGPLARGGLYGVGQCRVTLAYTMAVLASLVVALTVTPALSMALLPGRVPARDPPVIRWTRAGYQALLRRLADRPRTLSPE